MRRCLTCGKPIAAGRRSTAKYCDSGCRTRYVRGHRPSQDPVEVEPEEPAAEPGDGLVSLEQVAAELQRVLMAPSTPASSKAGLAKELRAVMAELARSKPAAKSVIDQLAERRAQRAG